ncbi:MAG: hypothetical protein R3D29_01205 [Nitratireductor sp.]
MNLVAARKKMSSVGLWMNIFGSSLFSTLPIMPLTWLASAAMTASSDDFVTVRIPLGNSVTSRERVSKLRNMIASSSLSRAGILTLEARHVDLVVTGAISTVMLVMHAHMHSRTVMTHHRQDVIATDVGKDATCGHNQREYRDNHASPRSGFGAVL